MDESDSPKEANLAETITAPKVRELIEKLGAAIERHKGLVAELRSAEADQRSNQEELQRLENLLDERNMDLARSGSQPPEEPFEEESLIVKAESKSRFFLARVQLREEAVSASKTEIEGLKEALWPAFQEFCEDLWQRKLSVFEEAARALKRAYIDLICIKAASNFRDDRFPPAVIIGRLPTDNQDGPLLHCQRITDADRCGEIHEALQTQRAEMEQLIACPTVGPATDLGVDSQGRHGASIDLGSGN
jgi:hypothetical protein